MALHRCLAGEPSADVPAEWLISRLCEEFGCTILEALAQPFGLALDILELRAYARAYAAVTTAEDLTTVPRTPMTRLVEDNRAALDRERLTRQGQGRRAGA